VFVKLTFAKRIYYLVTYPGKYNCRPVLIVQSCFTRSLSTNEACQLVQREHPRASQFHKSTARLNATVNFVCRDNVEGICYLLLFSYFDLS